jgi:valyl-tRNA synthetase
MNDSQLDSVYKHKEVEDKWYNFWIDKNYFHAKADLNKKPFTIVIPPPNITGILHMGHALNNTIQDILIRYKRMSGYIALWMPGTDHAGIATQNVVEKKLKEEGLTRFQLGREKFLERVWEWKDKYGSTIISQLKRLGASCDWQRLHFTMDEVHSNAVSEAFIRLYKKGLIYKGDYIINWCPRCETALSDEESQHKDLKGLLYYIKYPIKDSGEFITVATTRPETMLGDVAVSINPNDERYKNLADKTIILPILKRELKVIFDDFVDPKFGTGIVKVTPAHDLNDFEMGNRHNLKPILVMHPDGTMNHYAGKFEGLDRFKCREEILKDLENTGLLEKTVEHNYSVGHCYRCNTVIEPRLSKQWFVRIKPLAKKAAEAVRKGKIKFYPKRWTNVYLNWIDNIRDWCISRQIWWGHRLPVYYCRECLKRAGELTVDSSQLTEKTKSMNYELSTMNEKGIIVSKTKPEKCPDCGSTDLVQDDDVLDTWFSSWLWPFSTFDWPNLERDFTFFYPTTALVTAQEIIFFWVARMVMASLEFIGEVPFKDVYIHGTVRDSTGAKMSKSLGNIIDPMEVIDEFGADALRFSIISITAQGQDVFLSREKFGVGRNFANKLWNASRFILMNLDREVYVCYNGKFPLENSSLADRWILSNLNCAIRDIDNSLKAYNFNNAANILYEFIWHKFCDWYIEFVKPNITDIKVQFRLVYLIDNMLRLLHPFMPFITEELWQKFPHKGDSVMIASWPKADKSLIDKALDEKFGIIMNIVSAARNIRSEMDIAPSKNINILCVCPREEKRKLIEEFSAQIKFVAGADEVKLFKRLKKPKKSSYACAGDLQIYVPLEGLIDFAQEEKRLKGQCEKLSKEKDNLSRLLKNKEFLSKAPKEVVALQKVKSKEIAEKLAKLEDALNSLK